MENAAYRLLYDNVHDFKTTVMHVESEIKRLSLCSDSTDPVPGMGGRTHQDMWVSMKTVSHFNLGIALELMLKILLLLNDEKPIPKGRDGHLLATLHDALPDKFQKQLESTFQGSRSVLPCGYQLIGFYNSASSTIVQEPSPNRDIQTLKGFLEYFDEDVRLWEKRYSWELIDNKGWRHYVSDTSVFVELINRVMREIKRY